MSFLFAPLSFSAPIRSSVPPSPMFSCLFPTPRPESTRHETSTFLDLFGRAAAFLVRPFLMFVFSYSSLEGAYILRKVFFPPSPLFFFFSLADTWRTKQHFPLLQGHISHVLESVFRRVEIFFPHYPFSAPPTSSRWPPKGLFPPPFLPDPFQPPQPPKRSGHRPPPLLLLFAVGGIRVHGIPFGSCLHYLRTRS